MSVAEAVVRSADSQSTPEPGVGTSKQKARSASESAKRLGIDGTGIHSTDRDIASWEKKLWHYQDNLIDELTKEWNQHLYYCANHQYITWHRDQRRWMPRRTTPWRVRSVYNLTEKCLNLRVSRLTENKPAVTVQAATADREDLEKAELKEQVFWSIWNKLKLQDRWIRGRRWAGKCGIAFLKGGWDPEAGEVQPATKILPLYRSIPKDMGEPMVEQRGVLTEMPETQEIEFEEVMVGEVEQYVDRDGNALGPVMGIEITDDGEEREVRNPPPPETAYIADGEVFFDVRNAFNVRWDQYTEDIADSWYIQDAEVLPGSRVLALFPDKVEQLAKAEPASEHEAEYSWHGLVPRVGNYDGYGFQRGSHFTDGGDTELTGDDIDKLYLVRETWIFPKNAHVRRMWGDRGAVLITVGGVLIHKQELPKWALRCCPYVPIEELIEEGNHYGKAPLRDIIPLQDDLNRARSHMAEQMAIKSRLILTAPQNAQVSPKLLGNMNGVLVTHRQGAKPETMDFKSDMSAAESYYNATLNAIADVGNMNEASTGKLPSAGLAAKALYALQYADERSITEVSNRQDVSLQRLAKLIDWITRVEYDEARTIRVVGADRSYLVDKEVDPDALQVDVDYYFTPGSMLSRQKEAVKNEMISLMEAGLLQPHEVKKNLPTSTPEPFRGSYDLHEARARRNLEAVMEGDEMPQPQPWHNAQIHIAVYEEMMNSARFDAVTEEQQAAITQLWQAYTQMAQAPAAPQQGAPGAQGAGPVPSQPVEPAAVPFEAPQGAEVLAAQAEDTVAPPEGFGDVPPPM